jgi:hypothetical protein
MRLPANELPERVKHVLGEAREAHLDLLRLLVLGDVERIVVAGGGGRGGVAPVEVVRLDADVRRRHPLRVGAERRSRERVGALCFRFDQRPAGASHHGPER